MNKVIKLGMTFYEGNVPTFGSIEANPNGHHIFLLSEDIPKLNSTLTKTACTPYLADNSAFSFHTGDLAYILDWITEETGSVYMYHNGTDHWYEVIPNE